MITISLPSRAKRLTGIRLVDRHQILTGVLRVMLSVTDVMPCGLPFFICSCHDVAQTCLAAPAARTGHHQQQQQVLAAAIAGVPPGGGCGWWGADVASAPVKLLV
jgi:hypothetical protein